MPAKVLTTEQRTEQYKMSLVALAALRRIQEEELPQDGREAGSENETGGYGQHLSLRVWHRFAITNTENLAKRLQAQLHPGEPWYKRKV